MEEDFARAVEDGLKLSKRLVLPVGAPPPRPPAAMDAASLLPAAPMAYAVVVDPGAIDSPDVPSYQPHVYGRLDPPALIPLQMREVDLRVDCAAGCTAAEVTVRVRWWVHCLTRSRDCDCRVVVPMGDQVTAYSMNNHGLKLVLTINTVKATHDKFCKDQASPVQNFKDLFSKFEYEKEKLLVQDELLGTNVEEFLKKMVQYEGFLKNEYTKFHATHELHTNRISKDDNSLSILRKSIGSFLVRDDEFGPNDE